MKTTISLASVFIFLFFMSCNLDILDPAQAALYDDYRVKTVKTSSPSRMDTRNFTYNAQGQLTKWQESSVPDMGTGTFKYASSGIKCEKALGTWAETIYNLTIDQRGYALKKTWNSPNSWSQYEYNDEGYLVKVRDEKGKVLEEYVWQKGNAVKVNTYGYGTFNVGTPFEYRSESYDEFLIEFDPKQIETRNIGLAFIGRRSIHDMNIIGYSYSDNFSNYGYNAPLKIKHTSIAKQFHVNGIPKTQTEVYTYDFVYEKDSQGLITKCSAKQTRTINGQPVKIDNYSQTYEYVKIK